MGIPEGIPIFLHIRPLDGYDIPGGMTMRQEEKKPLPWEARDPKPPVVQSGHFENRRAY